MRSDPDTTNLAIEAYGELAGMIASFTLEGDRELTYRVDPVRWGRGIASGAVAMNYGRSMAAVAFGAMNTAARTGPGGSASG